MKKWLPMLACLLAACAAGDRPVASEARDSAGIRIITSSAPAGEDAPFRIDPEPVVTIGREDEGPYQFSGIAGAVMLSDGTVAAVDYRAAELRLFDANGVHFRSLGRPGEGPGEFRAPVDLFEARADSLAVFDQGIYRTTIFSSAGGEPRVVANPVEGNFIVFGILGDGSFLLYNPGQYRGPRSPGLQWDSSDVVLVDPTGASSRVIARVPISEDFIGADGQERGVIPPRFSISASAPAGFFWATSDRWEVAFRDDGGALTRILRRPVEPGRVTEADRNAYIERQLEAVRRFEGEDAVARYRNRFENESHHGEHLPLFGDAFVDSQQRLWVGNNPWPADGPSTQWSIFAPDGTWLGDVDAPARTRLMDASADLVLGIWRDELDVQHLRLHRLVPAGP